MPPFIAEMGTTLRQSGRSFIAYVTELDAVPHTEETLLVPSTVAGGVLGVNFVATLPHERRRGYGEAVTWRATMAEPDLPAVLLASDPGRPIYARMGYLPVTRFSLWVRPSKRE